VNRFVKTREQENRVENGAVGKKLRTKRGTAGKTITSKASKELVLKETNTLDFHALNLSTTTARWVRTGY